MTPSIILKEHGAVLVARLSRVENRNALDPDMKTALLAAAIRYNDDPALRCLVITGTDGIFCAGGDLQGMTADRRPTAVRARMTQTHACAKVLAACEKPVVTAVNGAAVGAGLSLALIGDIPVASDSAFFMSGFAKVSVLPDFGAIYSLPRVVGLARAKDILLTNRKIIASEALAMGLVSRVFPQDSFEESVMAFAQEIAEGPTVSLGLTKRLINESYRDSLDEALVKETLAQAVVFGTEDFMEGNAAFKEKRGAKFRGV